MTATTGNVAVSGAAAGYRRGATLSLMTEIRRQLSRRRTQYALGFMVLLPVILLIAFQFGGPSSASATRGVSLVDLATSGGPNFAAFVFYASATFLLVVVVALFCGDTVAGEASWGSLRYLLAAPVPRARLLLQKLVVGFLSTAVAVVLLLVSAVIGGTLVYGWHPLETPTGAQIGAGQSMLLLLAAAAFILVHLLMVGSLGFLLSVRTDQPLLAVGGAVMLYIISNILDLVPALENIRPVLPTAYNLAWLGLFASPVQLDDMAKGAISALLYSTVFLALAWRSFQRKDIVS
ncbi:ABC transporter permease [Fodinicola feengrottensis]|uniref:ABC transporter permease n=1 Tax=Fodinicola feengrottensis TaxID=435914 RepID=A0ABN2IC71_9ACTN|nr:ABC transporter permease subunit [Fodinicola feengrottensis]